MVKAAVFGLASIVLFTAGAPAESAAAAAQGKATAKSGTTQTAKRGPRVKAVPKPKPDLVARAYAAASAAAKLDLAVIRKIRRERLKPSIGGMARIEVRDPLGPLPANASPEERAFRAMAKARWAEAIAHYRKVKDPLMRKALRWYRLQSRTGGASFAEIHRFMKTDPHWPLQVRLHYRAEYAMAYAATDKGVLEFFKTREPKTTAGSMRLAEALRNTGKEKEALALIRKAWATGKFYGHIERKFLKKFGTDLTSADHAARVHNMLWRRKVRTARWYIRVKSKEFDAGTRALFNARMLLMRRWLPSERQVKAAIAKVPVKLRENGGLKHDLIRWHRRRGKITEAVKLLKTVPADAEPRKNWWQARAWVSRVALRLGMFKTAYEVAAAHGQTERRLAYEGEWLAGWVALRYMNRPKMAKPHFDKLYSLARWPVSKARGTYWLGRTAEAARNNAQAEKWYKQASQYAGTFYGQFAQARLGHRKIVLPTPAKASKTERAAFERKELVRVARKMHAMQQRGLLYWFVLAAHRNAKTPAERSMATALGIEFGRLSAAVRAAKHSGKFNQLHVGSGYPVIEIPVEIGPEPSLVLALIRQESEFNYQVVSWAGARGLMQLMPATARETAKNAKVPYRYRALTKEPDYNLRIGTSHLAELIDKFDGNYVLVMASYNAGAGAAQFWMRVNGDPRGLSNDRMIDWIESIPVDETRDYVQRVMEALQIYRARLGKPALAARNVAAAWRGKLTQIEGTATAKKGTGKACTQNASTGSKPGC